MVPKGLKTVFNPKDKGKILKRKENSMLPHTK